MKKLGIEKHLKNKAPDLHDRYFVLKRYLMENVYTYWGQSFPGGNDHGPQHIERVLEYLDKLLGPSPTKALNAYELFLAMMAVLYHDVGVLRQRDKHADFSKWFLEQEQNKMIFGEHDREIIAAAVVTQADRELRRLTEVSADLSPDMRLRIIYDKACVESLRAEKLKPRSAGRKKALDAALKYLREWLQLGLDSAFKDAGRTPRNEIFRMGNDYDLGCLLSVRLSAVVKMIGPELRSAMPSHLFARRRGGKGGGARGGEEQQINEEQKVQEWKGGISGGGCVPAGTAILTPGGECRVEELREGAEILSFDLEEAGEPIVTRVVRVHAGREPAVIRLNRRFVFTPSQPLYESEKGWMLAADLKPGMCLVASGRRLQPISHVERVKNYSEVYTLTTDHPTHNYVAHGLVCANKDIMIFDDWRRDV